jgi:hypothetical protein
MKRILLSALALALAPAAARAQVPGQGNASAYAPNMYNRQAQPLSPYLNMLRGGNAAVNYYYGVRPGTQPGAFTGLFAQNAAGPRLTFFPVVDTLTDLTEEPQSPLRIAPTGHPVGFNNTLNFFGQTPGQVFARSAQTGTSRRGR